MKARTAVPAVRDGPGRHVCRGMPPSRRAPARTVRARVALAGVLAAALLGAACGERAADAAAGGAAGLAAVATLSGADTAGYARAVEPRAFSFPADHGPHPDFRNEWWYFTGNLRTGLGRPFGFQLTFFRSAVAPAGPELDSEWATRQLYMAHFAVTDIEGEGLVAFDRFDRGALGLAGARAAPFRVWTGDWTARSERPPAMFPVRLRAARDGVAIDLLLERGKPVVLQGEDGLSRKGPEAGNASYYYSLTRMPARGTVTVGSSSYAVEGAAWLDREWSTSALSEGLVGWDWFALQLSDGRDLMYYRLRREDGSAGRVEGALVDVGGRARRLGADDVALDVLDRWTSTTGVRYPAGWRLRVPSDSLSLEIRPRIADQELDLAFRYWEGAVAVAGAAAGAPVTGVGYVELTGYGGSGGARDQTGVVAADAAAASSSDAGSAPDGS